MKKYLVIAVFTVLFVAVHFYAKAVTLIIYKDSYFLLYTGAVFLAAMLIIVNWRNMFPKEFTKKELKEIEHFQKSLDDDKSLIGVSSTMEGFGLIRGGDYLREKVRKELFLLAEEKVAKIMANLKDSTETPYAFNCVDKKSHPDIEGVFNEFVVKETCHKKLRQMLNTLKDKTQASKSYKKEKESEINKKISEILSELKDSELFETITESKSDDYHDELLRRLNSKDGIKFIENFVSYIQVMPYNHPETNNLDSKFHKALCEYLPTIKGGSNKATFEEEISELKKQMPIDLKSTRLVEIFHIELKRMLKKK